MAKRISTRKTTVQNTRNGSNAMSIQRKINRDYVDLFQDYRKLSIELWRKPGAKYILGGIGFVALLPTMMNMLDRFIPQTGAFIHENVDKTVNMVKHVAHMDDSMTDQLEH